MRIGPGKEKVVRGGDLGGGTWDLGKIKIANFRGEASLKDEFMDLLPPPQPG